MAKGSHRSPYATVSKPCLSASRALASTILQGKAKSKATDPLQGQHENGASAGEWVSNLQEGTSEKHTVSTDIFSPLFYRAYISGHVSTDRVKTLRTDEGKIAETQFPAEHTEENQEVGIEKALYRSIASQQGG